MIAIYRKNQLFDIRNWLVLTVGLIFCTIVSAQEIHYPDENRLETKASRSTQLYVDPAFEFATHKSLTLDISARSDTGEPYRHVMIFVYQVASGIEALDDDRLQQKSLLTILKTDDTGKVFQALEVAQQVDNLLLELRVVGVDNQILANFEYTDTVELFFGQ